jgi:hypothetical protein
MKKAEADQMKQTELRLEARAAIAKKMTLEAWKKEKIDNFEGAIEQKVDNVELDKAWAAALNEIAEIEAAEKALSDGMNRQQFID